MSRGGQQPPSVAYEFVTSQDAFRDVVVSAASAPACAIDTEFHRERTYYPKVALIQIQWNEHLALIDPLEVDIGDLAIVLEGDGQMVMHAAAQDLEVFQQQCDATPAHLFDTQIAAGFCGYANPSLAALVQGELDIALGKGDRLTDWMRRPLRDKQLEYAAYDVAFLLEIHERLLADLERRGRLEWAKAESELMRSAQRFTDPDEAFRKIKEARHLKGAARGIAQAIAAWRERTAQERDIPVRHVLSDLAVVTIAQRAPDTVDSLRKVRGVEGRHLKGPSAEAIIEAVRLGEDLEPPKESMQRPLDRALRPAVTLVSAWVSQLARDEGIDTALLATRADIEDFLRDHESGRLAVGWRNALAGIQVQRLADGEAALAFNKDGSLALEERSGELISSEIPYKFQNDGGS